MAYRDDSKRWPLAVDSKSGLIVPGSSAQTGEDLQALEKPSTSRSEERRVGKERRVGWGLVGGSKNSSGTNFTLMPAAVYLLRSRTARYYKRSTTDIASHT